MAPAVTLVIVPFWWLFQAGVLRAVSSAVEGDGSFTDTLVVADWGDGPQPASGRQGHSFRRPQLPVVECPAEPPTAPWMWFERRLRASSPFPWNSPPLSRPEPASSGATDWPRLATCASRRRRGSSAPSRSSGCCWSCS